MAVLFSLSAGLAFWLLLLVRRRLSTPGGRTFMWLLLAIATWSLTGAAHWIADSLDTKVNWARVQYAGVASVPPLWLMFALEYAGSSWTRRRRNLLLLWFVPAVTLLAAFTNDWHRALWPTVTLTPSGVAVYGHGWWFWTAAVFNYGVVLLGTVWLVRGLRRSRPPYRGQFLALSLASLLPLAGNLVYLSRVLPLPGVDPTALMFSLSAALFTWSLYRNHLFELVPVARDQLVESLSDAVIVVDPSKRVLDMNAAATRLAADASRGTGWLGRPIDELLPFLADTAVTRDREPDCSFLVGVNGSQFDARMTPVRSNDTRLLGWAVLLRDVTEQRRAAAERAAFETRMQEQQKRESLSVLAGGLAHDFNNLLAGIIGNADLLALRIPASSDLGGHVGAILLGAQRAADLVSKMLAYAGERHGASEHVDLDALIREMLDLLEASVARHCLLKYRGEPATIFADPVQVRQVAMNLIINAAEAVDEAGGRVDVTVGSQQLSSSQLASMEFGDEVQPGAYAFLEVLDNGVGMDEATLRRMFTPFYSTKPSGHGLGLSAVQGIVLGHKGALQVDSRPGGGTRFTVWFPLATVASRQVRSASAATPSLIS